jgi:hypothetical protein
MVLDARTKDEGISYAPGDDSTVDMSVNGAGTARHVSQARERSVSLLVLICIFRTERLHVSVLHQLEMPLLPRHSPDDAQASTSTMLFIRKDRLLGRTSCTY